ncbi:ligand-binding sensor domain-containing protein [Candidatus Venteria ishoeyi]|uniref:Two component regulator propeller n=1 Tax=Candidatus Venteria ishoeyi TaxID=1899563 RepID=A0A1H6F4Q6_9GAMM|nr:two-component regulator propeller domain-containing protein [Candidatus Venteria ishoeyi]SEH05082.1 Two component regulator propeller [Candidatus Venteria ishoeyi]
MDNTGGLWVGHPNRFDSGGISYYSANGEWLTFTENNTTLPGASVWNAIETDVSGKAWAGVSTLVQVGSNSVDVQDVGIVSLEQNGHWLIFNTENSLLPNTSVQTIYADTSGGMWFGMSGEKDGDNWVDGGLAYKDAKEQWMVFNTKNSPLPSENIMSIAGTKNNNLWIGTDNGLVLKKIDGSWVIFNTENSALPNNQISKLFIDNNNGLWIGTKSGLAHRKADGQWSQYKETTTLPHNTITDLKFDSENNLWVSTKAGLVYKQTDGSWFLFTSAHASTPRSDKQGGLWMALRSNGLIYRDSNATWNVFNTSNSPLPHHQTTLPLIDDNGGIWAAIPGQHKMS